MRLIIVALLLLPLAALAHPRCYVQPTPNLVVSTGCGDCEATELWLVRREGEAPERLVVGHDDDDIEKVIADISDPVFSLDSRHIYFRSAAWAVSGSIQRVDTRTHEVKFIVDGNSVEVIPSGPHRGDLLVVREIIRFDAHGESLGRESYLWLVSTTGQPRREIGFTHGPADKRFRRRYHIPDRNLLDQPTKTAPPPPRTGPAGDQP